ncbi:Uma2 family endonuclease [Actinosynnema sp. NPDC050436]|uniref:Uma2 family endonuclease n=1 Tax=Actinosynnema sp. NPDC050436 TaxID=3155659 RepID=UPI00340D1F25
MTVMRQDLGGRAYTVEDLEDMPDDGERYELVDGVLLVSPAPGLHHQRMAFLMAVALEAACPDGRVVVPAPFAVRFSKVTEVQPDVLVAREEDLTDKLLPVAPLLAVEVLSPSSYVTDTNLKKSLYERMGVESYWVVDPKVPVLDVYELNAEGRYELVTVVKGEEAFDAVRPFPVRIVPAELLGRLN